MTRLGFFLCWHLSLGRIPLLFIPHPLHYVNAKPGVQVFLQHCLSPTGSARKSISCFAGLSPHRPQSLLFLCFYPCFLSSGENCKLASKACMLCMWYYSMLTQGLELKAGCPKLLTKGYWTWQKMICVGLSLLFVVPLTSAWFFITENENCRVPECSISKEKHLSV